jgi:hypothetical protein
LTITPASTLYPAATALPAATTLSTAATMLSLGRRNADEQRYSGCRDERF